MARVAAGQAHVALQQCRCFMQHAVRTPAVRAGKNGCWPIAVADALVLGVDQRQRVIPAHTHKLILTTNALRLVRRSQKSFTHHRPAHAGFAVHLIANDGL